MDGSSPFFSTTAARTNKAFFFFWGTSLCKHVSLHGYFEGNLDSANKSKISRHNGVKLLSLCLSNYVYTMSDMKINAFEITDFFYRFSGNFIIQCFKAKRRIPINRWLNLYKYQLGKVHFSSIYVRCCLSAGKFTNRKDNPG